jgi:hypothetical protein
MEARTGVNIAGPSEFDEIGSAYRHHTDESEYCWGSGLTPAGLEDALPAQGGRYHGKSPEATFPQIRVSREM